MLIHDAEKTVVCDKCGSDQVTQTTVPPTATIPMSEFVRQVQGGYARTAMVRYLTKRVRCSDCEFTLEYTQAVL